MSDTRPLMHAAGAALSKSVGGVPSAPPRATSETTHNPWHEMSNKLHPCSISDERERKHSSTSTYPFTPRIQRDQPNHHDQRHHRIYRKPLHYQILRSCRHFERRSNPRAGANRHHRADRSEEHTSELQSLMRTSYAVFCLK